MHAMWKSFAILFLLAAGAYAHAQSTAPSEGSTTQRAPQADVPPQKATVDRIRDYTAARRAEALEAARKSTDALDQDIARFQDDVRDRWGSLSKDAKATTQSALDELRDRRTRLAEWYGGMQHGSDKAWDEVKTGFVDSYHTLSDAFRRARTQFDAARKKPAATQAPDRPKDGGK